MARRVTSVAELGAGTSDLEPVIFEYGAQEVLLRWNAAAARWESRAQPTIRQRGDWRIGKLGTIDGGWTYFTDPEGNAGTIASSSYTWDPYSILDADAAYAAGLTIEENLSAVFWNNLLGRDFDLAVVRYPMDTGDRVEPGLLADDHVSAFLTSGNGVRKWQTTGWVASTIDPPTKPILAPHLYSRWSGTKDDRPRLEYLRALWRWVGDPS